MFNGEYVSYFINYKKPEHPLKLIDWLIKKIKMLQKISLPIKLPFLCLKLKMPLIFATVRDLLYNERFHRTAH